jgi:prephenate dehydrogenase
MSEQKPAIAIVGLGVIGTSAGLCLRKAGAASQVIGHDKSSEASSRAKKSGAVDRTEWNLISACEKADFVLLALPFGAVRETLEAIAHYMRPGCVVLDTSALKAPVVGWADEILPAEAHFVGLDPIISSFASPVERGAGAAGPAPEQLSTTEPRADLFQNGLICVVPSGRAAPDAVKLGIDLVTILGARPLFLDALEHDGLIALTGHLPPVLALALLGAAVNEPAWKEVRKLAGVPFETGTHSLITGAADSEEWLANRDNLLRKLDAFSESLSSIRAALVEGDVSSLDMLVEQATRERDAWLARWAAGDWDEIPRSEMPKRSLLQPLFGGLWPRKPKTATRQKSEDESR